MMLSKGVLFALVILPSLGMARLHHHVKRHSPLVERALGSNIETRCDDENDPIDNNYNQNPNKGNQPGKGTRPVNQPVTPPVRQSQPINTYRGKPAKGGLLEANTKHPGFLIGGAVRAAYLDGSMDNCILPNYNLLVPEYEAKSDKIEPQSNQWVSSPVDTIVQYTKNHKMAFKFHTLFFDQTMATYFQGLNGKPDALKAAMKEHINGIMTKYGNSAIIMDVVNEILAYTGDGSMKQDLFYNTLGDEYLPFAFNTAYDAAKAVNSNLVLSLNDNDIEGFHSKGLSAKYEGMFNVLKKLKIQGVHVDMIGMEGHFTAGKVPSELATVIKNFAGLGVKVMITELDIISNGDDAQQAKDYAFVFDACLQSYPSCPGINMWGITDKLNWNGESTKSTMFDSNCNLKPIIGDAVKAVLSGTKTFA